MTETGSFCVPENVTVSDSIGVPDFIGNRNNTNWLWLIFYNNCTVKYTLLMTFTHTKNCSKYIHIRNRSAI